MKAIGYFIIGALFGLTVSELLKDKKPIVRHQDIYYRYAPRYPYGYDYNYRPPQYRGMVYQDNYNRQRLNNDAPPSRSDGSSGGNTEQGETHSTTRQVNDRVKRN